MAAFVRTQLIRHSIGPSGRLELKVSSADVRVKPVPGDEAVVRATFEIPAGSDEEADRILEQVQLTVDRGAGRLAIEEPSGRGSLGGETERLLLGRRELDLAVEIEMPAAAALRLATVSGNVTAEGLRGEQRYTTVSGDLFVADAGGTLRLSTVSGDATLRAAEPVELRSDTVSGDLNVVAPRLDGLRAHGVSGDIWIEATLAPAGEFRIETVSGDVGIGLAGDATFEVRGLSTDVSSELDHRLEGQHDRRRVVIGSGSPAVVFSSMSGDLSIRRPRRIDLRRPAEDEAGQLAVLEALERGEIDVDEAARRLAGGSPNA